MIINPAFPSNVALMQDVVPYDVSNPVDASTQLLAALNTGRYVAIDKVYYINSTISPTSLRLFGVGAGGLTFGPNGKILADAITCDVRNANITGYMSAAQYSVAVTGAQIVTAFGTCTYQNNSGDFDGADFTHTLAGNSMTLGLGALTGVQIRGVLSDYITLNASNRYVVDQVGQALTSSGAFQGVYFLMYDASNNYLGDYNPTDASSFHSYISSAAKIKIQLWIHRDADTVANLTSVIDLSKLRFLQLLDKAATFATAPGNSTHIQLGNCTVPAIFEGNTFTNCYGSTVIFSNCVDPIYQGNKVTFSYMGVNFTSCTGTCVAKDNDIDTRQRVSDGTSAYQSFYRAASVAASSSNIVDVLDNRIVGGSWGIENPGTAVLSKIQGNSISVQYCGISIGAGVNDTILSNDIDVVSGFAYCSIEIAGTHTNNMTRGNTCRAVNPLMGYGFGIVVTGGTQTGGQISGNNINAPIGIFLTNTTDTNQVIAHNDISYWSIGVHSKIAGVVIDNNNIRKVGSMRGAGRASFTEISGPNAAVMCETGTSRGSVSRNWLDAGDTYSLNITTVNLSVKGNEINHSAVLPCSINYGAITNAVIRVNDNVFLGSVPTLYYQSGVVTGNISFANNYSQQNLIVLGNSLDVGASAQFIATQTASATFTQDITLPNTGIYEVCVFTKFGGDNGNNISGIFHVSYSNSSLDILNTQQIGTTVKTTGALITGASLALSNPTEPGVITATISGVAGGSQTAVFNTSIRRIASTVTSS